MSPRLLRRRAWPLLVTLLAAGPARINAIESSHVVVCGGEAIGPRHIWWNFVHTDPARIETAKLKWRHQEFDPVPDDDEFIPLPES